MIHRLDDHYVISSRNQWLPGVYESEKAARLAFRVSETALIGLQEEANIKAGGKGGTISYESVLMAFRGAHQ